MQDMDINFLLNVFKRKWRIIIFIAFFCAILTGVYGKIFIIPVYRSSVSLYFGRVTESASPLEKVMETANANGGLGTTAAQLTLGSTLSGDYSELVSFDVIKNGVEDELAKLSKWNNKPYMVSSEVMKTSRVMSINIDSDDPVYCQTVANIYAAVFIAKIKELVGIQNAQIIEDPKLNTRPISPNIPRNMAIGFIGGFALTFMLYLALRMFDTTLKTSQEVENSLNLPIVGTVHNDSDYVIDPKNPILFSNIDESDNRSKIAEDFRVFRVNLINNKPKTADGEGAAIAVASPFGKEGKTFCTANLSASLAEAGYKVLLIDCDTGNRGLQSYFGTADDKGLMNILSGESDFDSVVKRNLNDLNMDVLFCGDNKSVNSANLMISPKFKELVGKLKRQYDYAFLDVSTHLGTADIVSAGSSADSVLLLVRAGKTEAETAKGALDALKRANLDVSGVILNGVEEV